MGEIRIKDSNGTYYLSPGKAITSIPLIGATDATITPGITTATNPTYTYINKIVKGSNSSYYFSNISSGLIKNLYKSKTIYIGGTATNLLYRRYTKLYYGFVTGKGGSRGGSSNYMADERTGGGGGAGGCCLFYISVASDTDPSFSKTENVDSKYTLTIKSGDYTIEFAGGNGANGGGGSGACTGGGGGGGSAGGAYMKLNGTEYRDQQYTGQHGPFYIVAYITSGTGGAGGGTWGNRGDASDKAVEFNSTARTALGITSEIKWSRADGQNGSSAAPGIRETQGAGANWYGSGGGQSGTVRYWSTTYSLE